MKKARQCLRLFLACILSLCIFSQSVLALTVGNGGSVTQNYQGYNHQASYLSIDGKQAFCIQFENQTPGNGVGAYNQKLSSNEMLRKVLYYGYRGPGADNSFTSNQALLMIATTQAASKANGHLSYSLGNNFYSHVSSKPSPPSEFKVYTVSTGGALQDLAYWEIVQTPPPPPAPKKGKLKITKKTSNADISSGNSAYSLENAKYGVYSDASCNNLIATLITNSSGSSQEVEVNIGTYYMKELQAPKGFLIDTTVHQVTVVQNQTTNKEVSDNPLSDPIGLLIKKVDAETGQAVPQGKGSLAGAEFTVKFYAGDYAEGVNPADRGVAPTRTWVLRTDADGFVRLGDNYKVSGDAFYYNGTSQPTLPYGSITIQETKPPVGYVLNPEIFVRKITPSPTQGVSTYNVPTIKEKSLDFKIKKVEVGTGITIPNTKFNHIAPDGTVTELTTDGSGEIVLKGIARGTNKVVETKAVDGYILNSNEFIFEVGEDNSIRVVTDVTNKGMSYQDGVLTVTNELAPFSLRIHKINNHGTNLEGAEFTLYSDEACTNVVSTQVSDANGFLTFGNIPVRTTYFLKETKAPKGYKTLLDTNNNEKVFKIEVNRTGGALSTTVDGVQSGTDVNADIYLEGNSTLNMKVVNTVTMQLPNTGSSMMIPLVFIGVLLMGVSVVIGIRNRNRSEV